jgi:predicted CoA-substrate-specific enzyme activase
VIAYICKYTPIEVFSGFGEEAEFLLPESAPTEYAETRIWPNTCSYAKAVLEAVERSKGKYEAIVFTDCCDALKHIRDILIEDGLKVYTLALPRIVNEESISLYAAEIKAFIQKYESDTGKKFDEAKFREAVAARKDASAEDEDYIALLGARAPEALKKTAERMSRLKIKDLTCSSREALAEDVSYAEALLIQIPCMRMLNIDTRETLLQDPHLKGIIHHTIKFCDFYGFESASLSSKYPDTPMVRIETDWATPPGGQAETRIEAFLEHADLRQKGRVCLSQKDGGMRQTEPSLLSHFAGIDIGSTSTNAVIIDSEENILASVTVPTGTGADAAENALEEAIRKAGISHADIAGTVATGYGRKATSEKLHAGDMTEIACHARGAAYYFPEAKSVIDIGGQDSKAIALSDSAGEVRDFAMNDKCAAGTGRFLELMAGTLGMSLEEMASLGADGKSPERIEISSMCTVFAESEVVSLLAQEKDAKSIICALDRSVANRVGNMALRLRTKPPYVMTGGVAKNHGVAAALEEKLGSKMLTPPDPQTTGALGAALMAKERGVIEPTAATKK